MVAYAVSRDANFEQVKSLLDDSSNKLEKRTSSKEVDGPIKNPKKNTMKFRNGSEVDYKKVHSRKKEGKCYYCKERSHVANCLKKPKEDKKDF